MCTSLKTNEKQEAKLLTLCQAGCGQLLEVSPEHIEQAKKGDVYLVCCNCAFGNTSEYIN